MSILTGVLLLGFFSTNFFGLNTGGGRNWVHEFHKVVLVDGFFLLLVIFMAVKFYIDARGSSNGHH